jgi:iduronate 2-sulfatase
MGIAKNKLPAFICLRWDLRRIEKRLSKGRGVRIHCDHMPVPPSVLSRRSFLGASVASTLAGELRAAPQARNVLFLAIDDLRCELGCYGRTWVKTPNIDRLASQGVTFTNAHCQISVCSPSRTSVMTGLRPDSTGIFDLRTHFRKKLPGAVTLPQQFRNNGYLTTAFSKIYHLGNHTPGGLDDPDSWSEPSWHPGGPKWGTRAWRQQAAEHRAELISNQWTCDIALAGFKSGKGAAWEVPSVEALDRPDSEFTDGQTTDAVIEALGELKSKPFFLGVGYLNPHLPFNAPKRFFDLYPPGSEKTAANPNRPAGAPDCATHEWGELRQYNDIGARGELPPAKARELVRGYYAATSFMDAQVGRVLDALEQHDLAKNTIVVLWGDNGFHLGDHGLWSKHSNFEEATHIPLIVKVPGHKSAGQRIDALTELVDLYPSICELASVPRPAALQGKSFAPLLEDPAQPWKQAACSQFPRQIPGKGNAMGYSIRTRRYRYTEWRLPNQDPFAREFYDYQEDPLESVNLVDKPASQPAVRECARLMRQFGTASLQEPA